jgi:hypothetical protein
LWQSFGIIGGGILLVGLAAFAITKAPATLESAESKSI